MSGQTDPNLPRAEIKTLAVAI